MNRFILTFKIVLLIICGILVDKSFGADIKKIDKIGTYGSIYIFRADPDIMYVFGDGIYRSMDGGDEWEKVSGSYFYKAGLNAGDPAILYGFRDQTDMTQSFHFSTDSGKTWNCSEIEWDIGQRTVVKSSPNFPYPVYADLTPINRPTYYGLSVSYDTCKTWKEIAAEWPTSIDFIEGNDSLIYFATYKRGIYRSRDKGESWDSLGLGGLNGYNYIAVNPKNPDIIYSTIENHGVYKTMDGGKNWHEKNDGLLSNKITHFLLNYNNPDHLFLGTWDSGIFISKDAGEKWEQLQPLPADSWIIGLALDERTEKLFFSVTCRSDNSKSGLYVAGSIFTSVDERNVDLSSGFKLAQNYPNPFNSTTIITYYLPQYEKVTLNIYNIRGEKVLTLINNFQTAGIHNVKWDGKDKYGTDVSSGVYIYQLNIGNKTISSKMLLIK
ncbi:T9SS type A sorting domain-containing protein [candidate division KSB1 bacterium]|nr:T9SS type A sorting domain-containing protein [candidate division KSB1 bacterium]